MGSFFGAIKYSEGGGVQVTGCRERQGKMYIVIETITNWIFISGHPEFMLASIHSLSSATVFSIFSGCCKSTGIEDATKTQAQNPDLPVLFYLWLSGKKLLLYNPTVLNNKTRHWLFLFHLLNNFGEKSERMQYQILNLNAQIRDPDPNYKPYTIH